MEDTAANLATDAATNGGEGTFTKDKAVTLTDEASIAELTAINTTNGDKTLTYTTVEDTAANLAADAATNSGDTFTQDKVVTVTDSATVAQLKAIDIANGDKTLTSTVRDTVANVLNAADQSNYAPNTLPSHKFQQFRSLAGVIKTLMHWQQLRTSTLSLL